MSAHFEAKLHGFRRTQDGVVISYVVNPHDLSAEMAMAPLGTRYMVAFSEIGDDEKPVPEKADRHVPHGRKERTPFNLLPLSQQAALRCQNESFQKFLNVTGAECAANEVRRMCSVESRAELNVKTAAATCWKTLEATYQGWLAERAYGDYVR